jgi:8-oxo-dGTP diphosphatase
MAIVRLAGGIVWRDSAEGPVLALIHRPRQADWSLPKGRLDAGEGWEEAALREVEEETACETTLRSFAGATIDVQKRSPRLALYWNLNLQRERPFAPGPEVDELIWLAPAEAVERLDHESERRLLQRSRARTARGSVRPLGVGPAADVAAARADVVRRLLAAPGDTGLAGLAPALELLERAEEALAGDAQQEAAALAAEARRLVLLSLAEPELSLHARALREEARALVPWRRRTIRRLLPRDKPPSPEAVHLAAALRDQAREGSPSSRWLAPVLGAVAGAAAAAFLLWFRGPR